jgi:hypothetical protein
MADEKVRSDQCNQVEDSHPIQNCRVMGSDDDEDQGCDSQNGTNKNHDLYGATKHSVTRLVTTLRCESRLWSLCEPRLPLPVQPSVRWQTTAYPKCENWHDNDYWNNQRVEVLRTCAGQIQLTAYSLERLATGVITFFREH